MVRNKQGKLFENTIKHKNGKRKLTLTQHKTIQQFNINTN